MLLDKDILYSVTVKLGWGMLKPTLSWCETNCKNDWSYKIIYVPDMNGGTYAFNFQGMKDYTLFKIKYS
jgi:hypothetical protein